MTFDQLAYFIAVVENDTFFDAAESLNITQSTLSKQIHKLEKELDTTLLDRSHRKASLTEGGTLFYNEALKLYRDYEKTIKKIKNYKESINLKLRIGTLPVLPHYHLTSVFKEFAELYPEVSNVIYEVEETELLNGFEQGKYDLIITREHLLDLKKYKSYLIREDELVVVLPSNHELAKESNINPTSLLNENFILMNSYTLIYQLCMELFKDCGFEANVIRTARVESIISAVSINEGISLLPKSNFEIYKHEDIVTIPLNPPLKLPVFLILKNKYLTNSYIKDFIKILLNSQNKKPHHYSAIN